MGFWLTPNNNLLEVIKLASVRWILKTPFPFLSPAKILLASLLSLPGWLKYLQAPEIALVCIAAPFEGV